jgi:NADPH-dependent 2,4-dienoyl-CoA reductase/sulfur reductase-like enzyme
VTHIVVVGAGLAGVRTVENLRREEFDGRLTLIGDEVHLPYDRPPLSKDFLQGARTSETLLLRAEDRWAELDVELLLGESAIGLDPDARTLTTTRTKRLSYDVVILATGSRARALPLNRDTSAACLLRNRDDADHLRAQIRDGGHVTIVGAGFLGAEVASSARALGASVTLVELESAPLARVVGPQLSTVLTKLHQDGGTDLRTGVTIDRVRESKRSVVQLSDGHSFETDAILVAVGAEPNTDWLANSGLPLGNGVVCDAYLMAGYSSVFAIGDICEWPNAVLGRRMRVEHWMNAVDQAAHVARSVARGVNTEYGSATYVWSDLYASRVQMVGLLDGFPITSDQGASSNGSCLALARADDRLIGAFGVNNPRLIMQAKRMIESRGSFEEALQTLEAAE